MKKEVRYAIILVVIAFILAKLGQVIFVLRDKQTGIIIYIAGWAVLIAAIVIFGKEGIDNLRKQGIKKLAKKIRRR